MMGTQTAAVKNQLFTLKDGISEIELDLEFDYEVYEEEVEVSLTEVSWSRTGTRLSNDEFDAIRKLMSGTQFDKTITHVMEVATELAVEKNTEAKHLGMYINDERV